MENETLRHVINNVEAIYPRINRPYRFDQKAGKTMPCEAHEDGAEFRLQFRMDRKQAGDLYKTMHQAYSATKANNWPDKFEPPFKDEGDGFFTFNAKIKAQYNNQITRPISHMDSKAQPLPEGFELTHGSTVNIACVLIPYHTKTAGTGVSLRLSAVQVLKLAERQGYNPFSAVDGGFTLQQNEDNPFVADEEIETDPFAEPEEKPKVKTRKKKATKSESTDEPQSDLNDILSKFAPSDDVDDNE
jgi:hypothetical protein|tara:strand:+ start:264 stop:998 length:735 start_codon:yes stop_codon:yes gene_type:complete